MLNALHEDLKRGLAQIPKEGLGKILQGAKSKDRELLVQSRAICILDSKTNKYRY